MLIEKLDSEDLKQIMDSLYYTRKTLEKLVEIQAEHLEVEKKRLEVVEQSEERIIQSEKERKEALASIEQEMNSFLRTEYEKDANEGEEV